MVFAPYTLLDLPAFLDNFARLAREYRVATVGDDPVWLLYLKYLIGHTFGWPALLLAGSTSGAFDSSGVSAEGVPCCKAWSDIRWITLTKV